MKWIFFLSFVVGGIEALMFYHDMLTEFDKVRNEEIRMVYDLYLNIFYGGNFTYEVFGFILSLIVSVVFGTLAYNHFVLDKKEL